MANPLLSIIVPVYNVEQYLRRCIDSILSQTFTDFELILVDDGSIDKSGMICDEYASNDKRVIVIHKCNGGQASARNRGLERSNGEYISFVDSDDLISNVNTYNLLINEIKEKEVDILQFPYRIIDLSTKVDEHYPDSNIILSTPKQKLLNLDYIKKGLITGIVCDKIYKKNVFDINRFYEGIVFEDAYFIFNLINTSFSLGFTKSGMYDYYIRKGSTMQSLMSEKKYHDKIFVVNALYNISKIVDPGNNDMHAMFFLHMVRYIIFAKMQYKNFLVDKSILRRVNLPLISGNIYSRFKILLIRLLGLRFFVKLVVWCLTLKNKY